MNRLIPILSAEPLQEITFKKFKKSEVQFELTATGMHDCDECKHFNPSTTCYLVEGNITPESWCNKFDLDHTKEGL